MNDSPQAASDRYAKFEELELAHDNLLAELDEACKSEALGPDSESEHAFVTANLARIVAFVEKGARTGAVLHGLAERRPAQQILDRWAACLFRAGIRDGPRAMLAPFDENAAPELDESKRPYVGLEAFDESENTLFRGRDDRIADLAEAVRTRTFVFVTGASGSGKSSLVLAGLLPALKRDKERGTDAWTILPTIVPGGTPLRNLAHQLALAFPGVAEDALQRELAADPHRLRTFLDEHVAGTCLIVIDQFEEVFTLRSSTRDNDSPAFIAALVALANAPGCRHRIVATFRKDREGDLAANADLQRIYFDRPFIVSSMRPDQLRDAIVKPAADAGLVIEDDVVDALVHTFSGDETGLPLLQYCLVELWERRKRNRVSARTLAELGDPKLAMAKVADEIYAPLSVQGKEATKLIFLALAQKVEGQEFLRTRKTRAELRFVVGNMTTADEIIGRFAERRLLKVSPSATCNPEDDTIEVAHEALLRNWTEFRKWVVEEGVRIDQRMFISRQAALWADSEGKADDAGQHDATGLLLSGIALRQALAEMYDKFPEDSVERRFLDASQKKARWVDAELLRAADAARKEAAWEREKSDRQRRRNNWVRGLFVAGLLAAAALIWNERATNADQRIRSVAAAARAKCDSDPELSRKLALHALREASASDPAKTADAVSAVYCLVGASSKRVARTPIPDAAAFALSPDGSLIAAADVVGNLREQSVGRGSTPSEAAGFVLSAGDLWQTVETKPVSVIAYSPDGNYIVVGASGAGAGGFCSADVCGAIALVSRPPAGASAVRVLARTQTGAVTHAVFSRDSSQVAVAWASGEDGRKRQLAIWNVAQVERDGAFGPLPLEGGKVDDAIARLAIGAGPHDFVYITSHDRAFAVAGDGHGSWAGKRIRHPECEISSMLSTGTTRRVLAQPSRTCVIVQEQADRPILVDEGNVVYAALRGKDDDILVALVSVGGGNADLVIRNLAHSEDKFVLRGALEGLAGCGADTAAGGSCENFDTLVQVADDGRTIAMKSSPSEAVVYEVEDPQDRLAPLRAFANDVVFSPDDRYFATLQAAGAQAAYDYVVFDTRPPDAPQGPPREVVRARVTPGPGAVLSGIGRTGTHFAVQDPAAAWTTIWKVDGESAQPIATIPAASVDMMPAFGGYKMILREEGVARACELYRMGSPDVAAWRYVGAQVSCNISDDGEVALVGSADDAGGITLTVLGTASDTGRPPAKLSGLRPGTRYTLLGDVAKYVLVAVPDEASGADDASVTKTHVALYAWRDGALERAGEYDTSLGMADFAARVFDFDPARDRLVVMEGPGRAELRSIRNLGENETLRVRSFDPTGRYVVTYDPDRDGQRLPRLDVDAGSSVELLAHGNLALAQQRNRTAVYDLATGAKLADVLLPVQHAQFSPGGTHLVVSTADGKSALPLSIERVRSLVVRGEEADALTDAEACRYLDKRCK